MSGSSFIGSCTFACTNEAYSPVFRILEVTKVGNDWRVVEKCSLNMKSASQNEFHPPLFAPLFRMPSVSTCKKGRKIGTFWQLEVLGC